MEVFKRFPSIEHPETYGFSFNSDIWDSRSNFCMYMRMWRTEGDGMIQHSHDWSVTPEFAGDYLHSLAQAALEDDELAKGIAWRFPDTPTAERMAFAAGIKFDTDKGYGVARYYSLELRKIGTSQKLEHDKRYERIERHHDGGPRSIWGILLDKRDHLNGLEKFILADAIREYTNSARGYGTMEVTSTFLGWTTGESEPAVKMSSEIRNGIRMVRSVVDAYKLRDHARSYLECYRHNLENERRRNAQAQPEPLQLSA
jgi:hypothetical protein